MDREKLKKYAGYAGLGILGGELGAFFFVLVYLCLFMLRDLFTFYLFVTFLNGLWTGLLGGLLGKEHFALSGGALLGFLSSLITVIILQV